VLADRFIVEADLKIERLSIKQDSIYNDSSGVNYIWQRRDFIPDIDMLIQFKTKN
jgi:hypothetical protein